MIRVIYILFLFNSFTYYSQIIKSEKYSLEVQSHLSPSVSNEFGTFLENEVVAIKLVSFGPEYIYSKDRKDALTGEYFLESFEQTTIISIAQDSIDQSRFKTIVLLNEEDLIPLLEAIYSSPTSNVYTKCYEPRHGIVFENNQREIIGFIEICFRCNHIRVFGKIPNPGLKSTEVYHRLKEIFMKYMTEGLDKR